jgi:hypothetical protein
MRSKAGWTKFGAIAGAAALAWLVLGNVAMARDLPDHGMTIEELVTWLKDGGYSAIIQNEDDGSRSIYSSTNNQNFHIYVYDCKDDRCASIQFSSGFDTKGTFNTKKMNDWVRDNRWTRAYVDKSNDPWVEFDVDLAPGGTYEMLDDEFGIWRDSLKHFRKYIGW